MSAEIAMEESPVGDYRANSVAETAVKNAQSQCRVLTDALESRINRRVQGDHQAVPWTVMNAATVNNKGKKGDQWFTAYRMWRGREFARPEAEFGESVAH